MGWVTVIASILQITLKIWDAIHERNIEIKKKKTEILQSGLRAIVDRDASRLNSVINDINRM